MVQVLTEPRYAKKMVVILAGYVDEVLGYLVMGCLPALCIEHKASLSLGPGCAPFGSEGHYKLLCSAQLLLRHPGWEINRHNLGSVCMPRLPLPPSVLGQ